MEKKDSLILPEEQRKQIYAFKKIKKQRKLEQEAKKDKKDPIDIEDVLNRAVEIAMDEMIPSHKKWEEAIIKAGDSAWFALSETERFKTHYDEMHRDGSECKDGCLEDFTMEDAKEYMNTIMKALEEEIHGK